VAAVAVVLVPASAFANTGDWPQFRESQTHQAHNTNETIISDTNVHSLGVAWTGATGGAVNSSPAVANGVVYVGSSDGKLYAFAVGCSTTGGACTPIWTANTGAPIDSSPSTSGNRVYVGSTNGKLYSFAVGCATGGGSCTPVWTATTGGPIHSSPMINSGIVYVGSDDGNVYAYGALCGSKGASCSPIWKGVTGGPVQSSPGIGGTDVYVGSNDGKVYAFAIGCGSGGATCSPLWTATTGGAVHSSPSTATGIVYVGSTDGKLYALDGATGAVNWMGNPGSPIYTSASIGDGRVWIGADDGKMYSFRIGCGTAGATCTPEWTGTTTGAIRSSPASAHDVLYAGSNDGKVYAWDADCATALCPVSWSMSIGSAITSSPAVSAGYMYVGSDNGKLYAFHVLPAKIVLSPASATVVEGASQVYLAEGFDGSNVDLGDFTALTTFAISGAGTCFLNSCGSTVGGTYTVTGTYAGVSGTATLNVSSTGATYVAIDPVRLLDTRNGNGLSGPFSSNVPRPFQVTGRGGVPANALAVTGNLTVTEQTSKGFLYIGPFPEVSPTSSTLNFPLGDTRANGVTVALGNGGGLWVTFVGRGRAAAIFDVTGYFLPDSSGATFVAVDPARLLDTRSGNGLSGAFTNKAPRSFQVAGRGGVPLNAVAVTGNLTATEETSRGFMFLGPVPIADPTSSTINFPIGDTRANGVTVALATDGSLSITFVGGGRTQAIFDVTGYFVPDGSGATFVALNPARLLDTRSGNWLSGAFTSAHPRSVQVTGRGNVPASAVAITGNVTVVQETSRGFVYVGPLPETNPTSSTINFPIGDIRANGLDVELGAGGVIWLTFIGRGTTQVIFDVTGAFVP
jgi:outer membrane protein assembly factor BamB